MMVIRLGLIVLMMSLLSCGGSGGGGTSEVEIGDELQEIIDNSEPVTDISQIAGVWDFTQTIGDAVDEAYLYISDTGEAYVYDYDGDSFNMGDNCYWIVLIAQLENISGNTFLVTYSDGDTDIFDMYISDDGEFVLVDGSNIDAIPPAGLSITDLEPFCEVLAKPLSKTSENTKLSTFRFLK